MDLQVHEFYDLLSRDDEAKPIVKENHIVTALGGIVKAYLKSGGELNKFIMRNTVVILCFTATIFYFTQRTSIAIHRGHRISRT